MQLHEGLEDFAYYINVKDVPKVPDVGELMDILFDDYALDSEYYDKDICKVYAPSENAVRKLERCLQFYGTKTDIIGDIVNKNYIYENKKYFNNKDMKRNSNLSKLMRHRMNESFGRESRVNRYDRILETYKVNMFGDFDPIFEAEDENEKKDCKCRYNGKLISKMSKAEKADAKKEVRDQIKNLKAEIKNFSKAGKSTKALEKKLEKLEHILNCLMGKCGAVNESSVFSTFTRKRRLFEGEDDIFADDDDNKSDDEPAEGDDKPEESPEETADNKDEYEDVEMKAVVLTVLKKNVETVKSAMVEAGVSEDDINVDEMDDDASDDDKVDIRVDVNSIDALKTYLESVGINLEEELDGEIVSNNDEPAEETEDDSTDTDDNADGESDEEFDDLFAE